MDDLCTHTVVTEAGRHWRCIKPPHDDDHHAMVRADQDQAS